MIPLPTHSQIPQKGSKSTQVSTNSTRKLELTGMAKEPFFQRAAPLPQPPEGASDANGNPTVHDVPE